MMELYCKYFVDGIPDDFEIHQIKDNFDGSIAFYTNQVCSNSHQKSRLSLIAMRRTEL